MADEKFHSFLRLPRIIRYQIYRYALRIELQPLVSPVDDEGKCSERMVKDDEVEEARFAESLIEEWEDAGIEDEENVLCKDEGKVRCKDNKNWGHWKKYQQSFPWVSSHQLMSCSRQLRQEVGEILSQEKAPKNLLYKLDIMTWESYLRSTWLSIPAPLTYMEHLELNVRFFRQDSVDWDLVDRDVGLVLARFFKAGLRLWLDRQNDQACHPQNIIQGDSLTVNIIAMLLPPGQITKVSFERATVAEPGPAHLEPHFDEDTSQYVWDPLQSILIKIAKAGYLFGKFTRVKLCYKTWVEEVEITDKELYDGRWAPGRYGVPTDLVPPLPQGSLYPAPVTPFPTYKGFAEATHRQVGDLIFQQRQS